MLTCLNLSFALPQGSTKASILLLSFQPHNHDFALLLHWLLLKVVDQIARATKSNESGGVWIRIQIFGDIHPKTTYYPLCFELF